ncbi:MAG: hypothetical protein AcusKO_47400 [Acuticoccus sp.]
MAFTNTNIVFGSTGLQGESSNNPTAVDYSKNGQPILYVTQQNGLIYRYEIDRLPDSDSDGNDEFVVTDTTQINAIPTQTQNYNDDGTTNGTNQRQMTGLVVTKDDDGNDVLYVSSSDWRISVGNDTGLDTNSGQIHKLVIDADGNVLSNVAILRGLPRSEENHSTNGLDISVDPVTGDQYLWIAQGGNTNKGAPGNNFSGTVDFALSGTILKVNLTELESYDIRIDANGDPYVLDLPTLDDPTRDNVDLVADLGLDPGEIPDNFSIDQGPAGQTGNPDFAGGNNGLNMAKITEQVLVSDGGELAFVENPLTVHAPGFRNQYDVLVTKAGEVFTWDNGPNGGWGGQPLSYSDGQIVDDWTSELATNEFNESGSDGYGDQLHYLGDATDPYGPYGGDANPIRASQEAVQAAFNPDGSYKGATANDPIMVDGAQIFANEADALNYLSQLLIIYEQQGNNWVDVTGTTGLPADFFDVVSGYGWVHPGSSLSDPTDYYDGTSLMDGTAYSPESQLLDNNNDGSLVTVNSSTNGLAEYTGTFFGGALQGAVIAAAFNGNLYFEMPVDTDGDGRTDAVDSLGTIGGFGSQPLGVTAFGDDGFSSDVLIDDDGDGVDDFAGLVVAATYGADNITVFMPGGSPADPSTDLDLDGVNNTVDSHVGDPTDGKGVRVGGDETELWHFELNNPATTPPGAVPPGNSIAGDIGINAVWRNGSTPQVSEDGTGALYDPGIWNLGGASTIVSIDEADTGSAEGAANDQSDVLGIGFATEPGTGAVSIATEGKNIFTYSLNDAKTWDGGEKWGLVVGPGNQSTFAQAAIVVQDNGGTIQYGLELLVEENDVSTALFVELPGIEAPTIVGVGEPTVQIAIDLDLSFGTEAAVARARFLDNGVYTDWVETGPLSLPDDVVSAVKGDHAHQGKTTGAFVGLLSTAATGDDSFGADWDFVEITGSPIEYGDGEILYRWNAGNATVDAIDGGPDWLTTSATVTGSSAVSGQNAADNGLDGSVPATAPAALYTQEIYGNDDGAPMGLEFGNGALAAGNYAVRLYMGNGFDGTSAPGERVFDVSVEGNLFLDDLDLSATFGHKVGGMYEWIGAVTDGTIDIDFGHVVENPLVNAVEIISIGTGNPAVSVADAVVGEEDGALNVAISAAPFPPVDDDITVTYEIRPVPGGATPEVDYTVPGATYSAGTGIYTAQGVIAGGSGDFTFPVTILGDDDAEGAEVFQVVITSVDGADAGIGDGTALITIADDDGGVTPGSVLYRVNAGGQEFAATDGGIAWAADTPEAPSTHLANAGSNNDYPANGVPVAGVDTTNLTGYGIPAEVLGIERWDNATDAAGEMAYSFDVAAGTAVEVRLFLSENFTTLPDADSSGDATGDRIFSVSVDGQVPAAFQDLDTYALAGAFTTGVVVTHQLTSDGSVDLEFLHNVENPSIKGIEVVALGGANQALLSIGAPTPASVVEDGDTGFTTLSFPLTFNTPPTNYVEVEYSFDINGVTTTGLTQALGVTDGAILVDVPNDDLVNGDEVVTVTVTGFVAGSDVATLGQTVAAATVSEDDGGPGPVVVAINAGGDALPQDGIDFAADAGFLNGAAFSDGGGGNGEQPAFDGTVYETERYGGAPGEDPLGYEIAVAPGAYTLELYFAEIYQAAPGERVFDVTIEGQLVLDDYDVLAENGGNINAPVVVTVPGTFDPASFGNLDALDIDFAASVDNAKVSAIVVRDAGGGTSGGGAATLTVNNGSNDIEASNFGNNSFEVSNVGTKNIAFIEIDVSDALLPDAVFDPFGLAGDDVGKIFTLNNGSDGGTGLIVPPGGFDEDAIDIVYLGNGGLDGYEKIRLEFNDFNPGESFSFGADMDPNSIAGSEKSTLDSGASLAGAGLWDVGGIGGAELSGSTFTVGYTDGSTSVGQLQGQGTGQQMGAEALSSQDSDDLAATLTVNGLGAGDEGAYTDGGPQVLIEGPAGETARILLAKGFIVPFTNEFDEQDAYHGQLDAQLAALEASGFPANNIVETQYVDIVLTGGVQDISAMFDFTQVSAFDLSVPDAVNEFGTLDEAQLPLGFVASVIDTATDQPKGPVTSPIHLTYAEVVSSDLSLAKTVSDDTPVAGDTITFELTVSNAGPTAATGVTVEDLLASGFSFVSATGDGSYDDTTGLWTVGPVANGGSATLEITAQVLADTATPDTVVYRVNPGGTTQAAANGSGPAWLGDTASDQLNGNGPTTEAYGPGITLTGGNTFGNENGDPVVDTGTLPGDTAASAVLFETERYGVPPFGGEVFDPQQWDFDVTNGDYTVNLYFAEIFQDADGARVFDVEIEGVLVLDDYDIHADVGMNVAVMKSFDTTVSDDVLDIDFTTVVDNAKISAIEIIARGEDSLDYTNRAEILTADQPDPDSTPGDGSTGDDDDASVAITLTTTADLELTKTVSDPSPAYGDAVTFTLTVDHVDGVDATGVAVGDLLPNGFTHLSDSGGGAYDPATGVWTVGAVARGGSATLEITAEVNGPITPEPETTLYRINVGGDAVAAVDGGAGWSADDGTYLTGGGTNLYNGGSGSAHPGGIDFTAYPALATMVPAEVFDFERWDAADAQEMTWSFPVVSGTEVLVRLYVAELFGGVDAAGQRVFDIAVEGTVPAAFENIDPFALAGAKGAAVVETTLTVNDNLLDLEFLHEVENPALKGIEIIALNDTTPIAPDYTNYAEILTADQDDPDSTPGDGSDGDDDDASVSVDATATGENIATIAVVAGAAEPGTNGQFLVTLEEAVAAETTLTYTVAGTATNGTDYALLTGSVVIPAGAASAPIDVTVIDDEDVEGDETVVVSLTGVSGGDTNVVIGTTDEATLTLTSEDVPALDLGALVEVTPDTGLDASTFSGSSFQITNTSQAGAQITSISIDLSTAILPDMVFDPTGSGGDATASPFTPNSGAAATGLVVPGDPASDPFSQPRNGGFDVITIDFTDFGAGEQFAFTTDVDPNSIQGVPGAGNAGAVSGYELVGSTVSVTFSNGQTIVGSLFEDGSLGGAQVLLDEDMPGAPTIEVVGVAVDESTLPGTQLTVSGDPTIRVTGNEGEYVALLQMDSRLFIASGEPPFDVTSSELPFYANEAMAGKTVYTGQIGAGGFLDIPVALLETDSGGNTPDGGLNQFVAVTSSTPYAVDQATSLTSNILTVRQFAPLVYDAPGIMEFGGAKADVLQLPPEAAWQVPEGTIAFSFNAADAGGTQGLFSRDAKNNGEGGHTAIYLSGDTLIARFQDADSQTLLQFGGILPGEEYEIAATFGANGVALWVNGNLVDSAAFPISWANNTEYMEWGGLGWSSTAGATAIAAPFEGMISDKQVYSEVLTASQIAALAAFSTGGNNPPTAVDDAVNVLEDGSVNFDPTLNDSDTDGGIVAVSGIASGPANGGAVVEGDGTVTYTPDADFFGVDSFEVEVSDGQGGTATSTVSVTVDPVNDDPVAAGDAAQVVIGNAIIIDVLANDTDADPDTLAVIAVTDGTAGTVAINPDGTVTYTHDGVSPVGADSFTYTVSDGNGGTDTATVDVQVLDEPNAPPVAAADAIVLAEDGSATFQPGDNDTDDNGDTVVASAIASGPANGTAEVNPDGTVTYTPDADFNGADSFSVTVTDGNGGFDTALTSVTVTPVNDAPVANDDAATTSQNTPVVINLLGNDTDDGDGLSALFISAIGAAANGSIVDNGNGTVTYTPDPGASGPDSFTYEVSDGEFTDTATVDVTVSSFPTPIYASPGEMVFDGTNGSVMELPHDPALAVPVGTVNFEFNAADTDGQQGLFAKDAKFYGGGGHTAIYLSGTALLARLQDDSSQTVLRFDGVSAGQDYEVAVTFGPDGVALWVNGTLADSDDLAVSWEGNDEYMQWGGRGWSSQPGQSGYDAPFNGTISDKEIYGVALTADQIADLHADGPPNADPVALDDILVVAEDGSGSLDPAANDSDADVGDVVTTVAIAAQAANGTAVLNPDGTVTYAPLADFFGSDSFDVQVSDGRGGFDTSTVDVTVTPVDDDPIANDDSAVTGVNVPVVIDLTANDVDPDGDALTVQNIDNIVGGSVTDHGDGTVTFMPDLDFEGAAGFTYEVSDGAGPVDGANVGVTVTGAPTLPTPVFEQAGVTSYSGASGDVDNYAPDAALNIPEGTIAFSFIDDNPGSRQGLVVKDASGYAGGGNHFAAYINGGDLLVRFQDGGNSTVLAYDNLIAGQEYEVAATFGSGGVELFVDGVSVDGDSGVMMDWTSNAEWLQVGGLGWSSATGEPNYSSPLSGEIADVQIFDEVLDDDLINQLSNESSFDLV